MDRAGILFKSFPKAEAEDPEFFGMAVSAMLSRYPMAVVLAVTDPLDGIARDQNWRPTIHEVYAACEKAMAPYMRQFAREESMRVQREESERIAAQRDEARKSDTGVIAAYLAEADERKRIADEVRYRKIYGERMTEAQLRESVATKDWTPTRELTKIVKRWVREDEKKYGPRKKPAKRKAGK